MPDTIAFNQTNLVAFAHSITPDILPTFVRSRQGNTRLPPERTWAYGFLCVRHGVLLWLLLALVLAWCTPVQVYALALGALQPKGEVVQVLAPSSGRLARFVLTPNRQVRKGELLLELDTLGLSPQEAQAQLQAAESQVEEARRALAQQQEILLQRQRLARLQAELYAVGGVARVEYQEAQDNLRQAQAAVQLAQARVRTALAQLATLRTRRSLRVYSPTQGQVLQAASLRAGEWVSAGQPLAQILLHDVPLVFRGYVPERERPKLREGARAEVAWNAYPRQRFGLSMGRVSRISPSTLVVSNTPVYEVEILLDSLELKSPEGVRRLLPGLAGEARVIAARRNLLSLLWDWIRGVNPWG
ncbi:HlyD family efflux transporter periplasmic adaptor subunit [Meiothermus sp. CFH 77666]|nr:HlyD family efflux transporter periplasmic adaptor subunit [Meiothermus sp. CFH 77666]